MAALTIVLTIECDDATEYDAALADHAAAAVEGDVIDEDAENLTFTLTRTQTYDFA